MSRPSLSPFAAWAQPNLKSSAAVLFGFRLNKNARGQSSPELIRQMSGYGMLAAPLGHIATRGINGRLDGEKVCSLGNIVIYQGREARDPEIALLPSGRRRFDGPPEAVAFNFKTRTGVLLGGTMPSDCSDRQSICSSCKTKVSFNEQTR